MAEFVTGFVLSAVLAAIWIVPVQIKNVSLRDEISALKRYERRLESKIINRDAEIARLKYKEEAKKNDQV